MGNHSLAMLLQYKQIKGMQLLFWIFINKWLHIHVWNGALGSVGSKPLVILLFAWIFNKNRIFSPILHCQLNTKSNISYAAIARGFVCSVYCCHVRTKKSGKGYLFPPQALTRAGQCLGVCFWWLSSQNGYVFTPPTKFWHIAFVNYLCRSFRF